MSHNPPPPNGTSDVPLIHELKDTYKLWHVAYAKIPKTFRYTLGATINSLFTMILQQSLNAGYSKREEKPLLLANISKTLDHLKLFITLLWELKGIDTPQYGRISQRLTSIGKMIGGWIKEVKQ